MDNECLTPIEVKAVWIIANAMQHQLPEVVLFGQLCVLANTIKQAGHEDDYQAVLRIIGYLLKDM